MITAAPQLQVSDEPSLMPQIVAAFDALRKSSPTLETDPAARQSFENDYQTALEHFQAAKQNSGGAGERWALENSDLMPTLSKWKAGLEQQDAKLTSDRMVDGLRIYKETGDLLKVGERYPGLLKDARFLSAAKDIRANQPESIDSEIAKAEKSAKLDLLKQAYKDRNLEDIEKAKASLNPDYQSPVLFPTTEGSMIQKPATESPYWNRFVTGAVESPSLFPSASLSAPSPVAISAPSIMPSNVAPAAVRRPSIYISGHPEMSNVDKNNKTVKKVATRSLVQQLKASGLSKEEAAQWLEDNDYSMP